MTVGTIIIAVAVVTLAVPLIGLINAIRTENKGVSLEDELRLQINSKIRPQKVLTLNEFGLVERDFPGLSEVIVVCHMVEDPDSSLREAVIDNFKEGVRYQFCVSRSNYKAAQRAYEEYFRSIFQIAKSECGVQSDAEICDLNFDDLFRISPLRSEWSAWPYVFYVSVDADGQTGVAGYRGDQRKEGIAEHYVQLRPTETESILNVVKMAIDDEKGVIDAVIEGAVYEIDTRKVDAA